MAVSVIKNPPILKDIESYEQWKEDVLMWKEITDLGVKKQALAVHLTLKGPAKEVANQVSTEDKKKENGLEILIKKLDEAFLKEPERRKFMAYQDFEECVRKEGMSICDFMREFDTKYFKMREKKMELPDEVLAFRLVKNCKLTEVQRDQVMASTKPLSFKEVRATLKRMFESSGSAVSSNSEMGQGVRIKEEPLYMTKGEDREGYNTGDYGMNEVREEDVMWTTNYRNRRGYGRYRRPTGYGWYDGRNSRRFGDDGGCFECGSKDHWVRDCGKRKEFENKYKEL